MPRTFKLAAVLLMALGPALAQQPVIFPNTVTNAASFIQPGLPNYGLAQGGMFVVKGMNLGDCGFAQAQSFPLGNTMGHTSVKITVRSTTVNVLMVYVSACQFQDQLAGIVPSNTPTGNGTITVTYNNRTSAPSPVTVVTSAFGILSLNQGGTGPGLFTDTGYTKVNSMVAAAHAGDQLFIWGTGLGPITGSDAVAPTVGNLDVPLEVYVGNQKAAVGYQGRSGCCASLDQILFTVPTGVQGCAVSVVVKIGNVVSNFATMSIAPSGNVCSDPSGFTTSDLQKAQTGMTVADVSLLSIAGNFSVSGTSGQGTLDLESGHFRRYQPGVVLASTRGSVAGVAGLPSAGCVVYPFTRQPSDGFFKPLFDALSKGINEVVLNQGLDAGSALTLKGLAGAQPVARSSPGQNSFEYSIDGPLGGGIPPLSPVMPEFLVPGSFTVDNGPGGNDVGPFSASITIPVSPMVWTNQSVGSTISRSQDLTITWSGNGSGPVAIIGASADPNSQAGAQFYCLAPGVGSFTVPAWVLSALPASGLASNATPIGFLSVGATLPSPTRFQPKNVDVGYFNWGALQSTNVNYQ